jgi:acylphosphatase
VQGVGFRMTTHAISSRFAVTGWVRNLPDGSVELEAQGAAGELDSFLATIDEQFRSLIRDAARQDIPVRDDEASFGIRK